jgi:sugar phosphate isomerase/epimerase
MRLGIFTPEVEAGSTRELFEKIRDYGFNQVQFDFLSVCGEEMPGYIKGEWVDEIAVQSRANGIEISAVNGTFNMAHPDEAVRMDGVERFERIAAICGDISCGLITICTGTRNRNDMWMIHKDNATEEAWRDMASVMERLIAVAEKYDVCLGLETEASNVVFSPERGKRIIGEMQSDRLKVIMDCANLFRQGMTKKELVRPTIENAFDLLGDHVVLAHGKDVMEGPEIEFTGTGLGMVDYDLFFSLLEKIGYRAGS